MLQNFSFPFNINMQSIRIFLNKTVGCTAATPVHRCQPARLKREQNPSTLSQKEENLIGGTTTETLEGQAAQNRDCASEMGTVGTCVVTYRQLACLAKLWPLFQMCCVAGIIIATIKLIRTLI